MRRLKLKISPSLLSADFGCLADEAKKAIGAGCDMLHLDVMDGHFVPNITIGPVVVKWLKKHVDVPLDVHLMIENPRRYIESFIKSGSDLLTIHVEASDNPKKDLLLIRALGARPALSLKPATPIVKIKPYLKYCDMVLVMTVNPGFGGQEFMPGVVPKITQLRKIFNKDISVDGGINDETGRLVVEAGANVLVAGNYIFGKGRIREAIRNLKRCEVE